MFERMLDKSNKPTYEELIKYCGSCGHLFEQLDAYLVNEFKTEKMIRFPYGNNYGWSIKYFIKSKLICDIFAEKEAFTVMIRLTNTQIDNVYDELLDYTKEYCDNKYTCGEGGWIHYRVQIEQQLVDIEKLLKCKIKCK